MPRRLWLLRHGSAEPNGLRGDEDRALSAEGMQQARRIGAQLAAVADAPTLILCSPARRARETAALVIERAGQALRGAALHVEPPLYLASAGALLSRLAELDPETPTVLIVGHNPGLSDLSSQLVRSGPPLLRRRAALGLATAELLQLECAAPWTELERAGAEVSGFLVP
jgi:phosphohistidine phosphatase